MIDTLSQMYVPMFGTWTKILFLVGVWAVLFKTLYVNSAAHSRLTADFLNLSGVVHYPNAEARARLDPPLLRLVSDRCARRLSARRRTARTWSSSADSFKESRCP